MKCPYKERRRVSEDMKEVAIDSIRVSLINYQRVVLLREIDGDRYLPIWIGPYEADAIAVCLKEKTVPRPLTHDFLKDIIDNLGASVSFIDIYDLKGDTFFAHIALVKTDGQEVLIDCRPSDALALAVRSDVPVYAEETVLDRAGIIMDRESGIEATGEEVSGDITEGQGGKFVDEQGLAAFDSFIDTLDLDDFDNKKP